MSGDLFVFNGRGSGSAARPSGGETSRGIFRSGGQTFDTPRRPSVSVPRPDSSGSTRDDRRGR